MGTVKDRAGTAATGIEGRAPRKLVALILDDADDDDVDDDGAEA